MDSNYHSTVMQRPKEEEEDSARRESMNGTSSSNTRPFNRLSPTQTDFHSPFSPTNGNHPRPPFSNPYHPQTPAPLPMPTSASHIPGHPASPRTLTTQAAYQGDYQPAPRDKPTSNYYDPTSDSSERRPSESAARSEGQGSTQVRTFNFPGLRRPLRISISDIIFSQSREPYIYPSASVEQPKYFNGSYTSPVAATFPPRSPVSHAHPLGHPSISQSPSMAAVTSPDMRHNGVGLGAPVIKQEPPAAAAVRDLHPHKFSWA